MARRLIVDTSVLMMSERGQETFAAAIEGDDDSAIAAITVAELRTGVELASEARRAARREFLGRVLETLPIEPYDLIQRSNTAGCWRTCTAREPNVVPTT